MSLHSQAKILRVIEAREIQPLGSSRNTRVNIRMIAATNQNLELLISKGSFRKDLFFRLKVAALRAPSLIEHKEDIPELCSHFVTELKATFGLDVAGFTDEALDHLMHYDWPGNVRELRNVIEATFISQPGRWIKASDLPEFYRASVEEGDLLRHVSSAERDKLLAALCETKWNKAKAARKLHWSRMTLYRKMRKHDITEPAAV